MDDALCVRGVERIGDLHPQIQYQLYRHGLSANPMLKRLTVEKLHGQERPIVVLPDFINCTNVGMIESRSSPGFALKTLERLAVASKIVRQEFQRCLAAQAEVFGLINDTHPAAAEFFQNAIVRDGLANHYFRNRSSRWMLGCDQVQVNVGTPDGCR